MEIKYVLYLFQIRRSGDSMELNNETDKCYIPNETTRCAMIEARAKESGLIPDDTPSFTNVDELMRYLDK